MRAVCHTSTRRLTTRWVSSQGARAAKQSTQSTLKNYLEFRKIFIFLQTTIQCIMYGRNIYDYMRPEDVLMCNAVCRIGRREEGLPIMIN